MSGKILTAVAAAIVLASAGLASAQTETQGQAQRHKAQQQRYYNMVPDAAPSVVVRPYGYNSDPSNVVGRDAWPQNGAAW